MRTHHMTVQEFEEAMKATNENFTIDEIIKPGGQILRVRGHVPLGNSFRKVVWHVSGKCFSPQGSRLEQFDINIQSEKMI